MPLDFIHTLKQLIDLPEPEEEKILKLIRPVTVRKGAYYIEDGQVPKRFGFVSEGLFRYLYRDTNGNEFTKNFLPEGSFIASYSAMVAQQPSSMFIEALEDSMIYELNYADWIELKKDHPCWNFLLIAILEKVFSVKESRERDLLLLDAQQRYDIFREEYPGLESRIRQHMIASYLGISPVSLSRLLHKER